MRFNSINMLTTITKVLQQNTNLFDITTLKSTAHDNTLKRIA